MKQKSAQLHDLVSNCLSKDQFYFRSRLKKMTIEGSQQELEKLARKIEASAARVESRKAALPRISYPPELPLTTRVEAIKSALQDQQVVIVAGETGSGKTTQLPKICLDMGRGIKGMIGHTQPRRLAARTVCQRIGEELGVSAENESAVAYQVRFQDFTDDSTYVKLMTDGILLSETRDDPFLNKYDTIIIDEAHERSLNIDFLLGYLKKLLPKRPDLKLIVTSATIDVEKFSRHFDGAPVIEVSGRTYPVNILYRSPEDSDEEELNAQIIDAIHKVRHIQKKEPRPFKDILVFLSGEKEIREAAEAIRKDISLDLDVLPLYARLSNSEQNRVFQSHPGQRVVLATNVAETSLTVPGIGYVIDSGVARISRYSVRSKIQRLPVERVSQASANQRAGRCGRLCPGTCIRLYSQEDFLGRSEFTDTEIMRTNLASVILQMLTLRIGDIESFPFVDPPETSAIRDGFQILEELGAVSEKKRITPLGKNMARFPVDPRFARILLSAEGRNCLHEILIIVSGLSIQDPRERPLDKQQAADEMHARFKHPESDFLGWVKLWEYFEEQRQQIGRNRLGKFCRKNFLSWLRMGEWRDVHRQLRLACQELKLSINTEPATYEQIHQTLLTGLVSHVANRIDENTWLGARNRKFRIFPGSNLHGKKYPWILAAELVETSQLFARMNGRVEPEWIEKEAGKLLKFEYSEPHWEKRRGKVVALEKITLYGLALADKRKKIYSAIDPVMSREIFIREGLVQSQVNTRLPFYKHNLKLIHDIEAMEDKARRKDILVREEDIYQLYDKLLPDNVLDQASLERWVNRLKKKDANRLFFEKQDLLATDSENLDLDAFPDRLEVGHLKLKLDYQFQPGAARDGVSVDLPLSALMQLKTEDLDWLVPGMLKEKCIALVKALPKPLRKHFVPVPDVIDKILPQLMEGKGDLKSVLAHQLQRQRAVEVQVSSWDGFDLPDHLQMNINVVDQDGKLVDSGRCLDRLKKKYADASRDILSQHSATSIEEKGIKAWTFGELEEVVEIDEGSLTLHAWPALVDEQDSVALVLEDSLEAAQQETRKGIARLFMIKNRQQLKYLQKEFLQDPKRLPAMNRLGGRDTLVEHLILAAYQSAFGLENFLPRTEQAFEEVYEKGRSRLVETITRLEKQLYKTMDAYSSIVSILKQFKSTDDLSLQHDVNTQLDALVYDGFLSQTPVEILDEYPRYFAALEQRLEKYPRQRLKDREFTTVLQHWWEKYSNLVMLYKNQHKNAATLSHLRWMIEELRVSLFAQTLGTRYPISEKRLEKAWKSLE